MEIRITKDNFEAEVLQADRPVLLDFGATWCGPCQMLKPLVAAVAEAKAAVLKVGTVDVDEEPELAARFGIMSVPTLLVFKGGKLAGQSVGYVSEAELDAFLAAHA